MSKDKIIIKGAREHNLKNINLTIPRDKFVVFTGISGSGKSSLAFDTIYAEGQRRYVESLSSYARQFLGQMEKPDVDYIEGLSPAISIDQKTTHNNPRSTVGTVTEIYDYLRLLFARVGTPHCHLCGKEIKRQTVDQITDQIAALPSDTRIQLLAPVVRRRKGEHTKLLDGARKSGYVRVRIDGIVYDLSEEITIEKNKKHTIEIVIDRIVIKDGIKKRLSESIEAAMSLTKGIVTVLMPNDEELMFSQNFACPDCGLYLDEIEPRMFSFNNPQGACPDCTGLGFKMEIDPDLVMHNGDLSLLQGAINVLGFNAITMENSGIRNLFTALAERYEFDLNTPFNKLSDDSRNIILYGIGSEKIPLKYFSNGSERIYN